MPIIKQATIRFNLENPEHKKAWSYLQNMDRKKFKSYSAVIITALNEYFDKSDADFADALAERIIEKLNCSSVNQIINEQTNSSEEDIAWGFLGEPKKQC